MATLTTLQSVLKEFYAKAIAEQLNQEVLMLQLFEKAKLDWSGKRVIVPVHTARNPGVDFKAEGAALPTAGSQTYNELHINAKFLYGRFSLTGPAISSAKGAYSFGNYVDLELRRLTQDVRKKANESMFSGGSIAGYTQERKAAGAAQTWEFDGNAQWLSDMLAAHPGLTVSLVRGDTLADAATGIDVTAVDVVANTFTEGGAGVGSTSIAALNVAGNTVAFAVEITGPASATAAIAEQFTGINTNLSSPTHFGVDRTTATGVTALQCPSIRTTNSTGVAGNYTRPTVAGQNPGLTPEGMQSVLDSVNAESGEEPNSIMMNPVHRATYTGVLVGGNNAANLFVNADKATKGDAGFSGIGFNNTPIRTSVDCGKHLIYFLKTKAWKLAELEKPGFADLDGNILSRSVNLDAYEGYYRMYMDLYCERPNANGVLLGFET